jgi:hypothetical protein
MLHCGAQAVDMQEVRNVPTPLHTKTHYPIPHGDFIDVVGQALKDANMNVKEQVHALNGNGSRYFGLVKIGDEDGKGYSTVIGLRNSHNKSFSAGFVMGSQVFVCDNLCLSGEVKINRKHTVNIMRDLPGLVSQGIGQIGMKQIEQDQRIAYYKDYGLRSKNVHDFLVRAAVDNKVFAPSRIPRILKEYRTPSHEEFLGEDGGQTAWTLMNAITEHQKGLNVFNMPKVQNRMIGMLDALVGRPNREDWNFQYEEEAVPA